MTRPAPIAVSIGEPAGIGPRDRGQGLARLGARLPFFVIGDPAHLTGFGAHPVPIARPQDAAHAALSGLPVLAHPFAATAIPGQPTP